MSETVGDVHIFKHRLYISALEQARVLKGMETIQKYEINFAQTFKIC